jgi:hypothetical protein
MHDLTGNRATFVQSRTSDTVRSEHPKDAPPLRTRDILEAVTAVVVAVLIITFIVKSTVPSCFSRRVS